MPPPSPLSPSDLAHWRAKAEAGEEIPLEITARFIATIRAAYTARPAKNPSRNKPPPISEEQLDFI
jgi:hypothetical protein